MRRPPAAGSRRWATAALGRADVVPAGTGTLRQERARRDHRAATGAGDRGGGRCREERAVVGAAWGRARPVLPGPLAGESGGLQGRLVGRLQVSVAPDTFVMLTDCATTTSLLYFGSAVALIFRVSLPSLVSKVPVGDGDDAVVDTRAR